MPELAIISLETATPSRTLALMTDQNTPARLKASTESMSTHMCLPCNRTFTRATTLRRHMRMAHGAGNPSYACSLCARTFTREDDRKRHMLHQHDNANVLVLCRICNKNVRPRCMTQHQESAECQRQATIQAGEVVRAETFRSQASSFLPSEDFWSYADLTIMDENQMMVVKQGPLCASWYLRRVDNFETRNIARVNHAKCLLYATVRHSLAPVMQQSASAYAAFELVLAISHLYSFECAAGDVNAAELHVDGVQSLLESTSPRFSSRGKQEVILDALHGFIRKRRIAMVCAYRPTSSANELDQLLSKQVMPEPADIESMYSVLEGMVKYVLETTQLA